MIVLNYSLVKCHGGYGEIQKSVVLERSVVGTEDNVGKRERVAINQPIRTRVFVAKSSPFSNLPSLSFITF